jgi:hypothetical protein
MTLGQCLENLKHDVSNGGLEDDTFGMICYIAMANEAQRLLRSGALDQPALDDAREYLTLCRNSGSDGLRCVAGG